MTTSPGRMNAAPPTTAPAGPATLHAQKIASCVDAGPGKRLHAEIASSNSDASIHRRRSTHRSRNNAMCVGGPPKPTQPIRPHCTNTAPSPTLACAAEESAAAINATYDAPPDSGTGAGPAIM